MIHHAAPQGAFAGDLHRIGVDPQPGDAEALEMRHPGLPFREALAFVPGELRDHRPRELAPAHVVQGGIVEDVVRGAGPQQIQEVQPALGEGGGKPGKIIVADLGADAVPASMPGTGVIDRDPGGGLKPPPQHTPRLAQEHALAFAQQANDLPLGDIDTKIAQLRHKTRNRHLAPVVLRQNEAP